MGTNKRYVIILLLTVVMSSFSFAQDNTQAGLPEGAIARLGKGGINIMRFSPDGTRLAVGTDVGVWLYDVETEKGTYIPHIIVSQSQPLQDVINREEPISFSKGVGQVNALAFSQDGKTLACGGSRNPIIQLWDVNTGSQNTILTSTESPLSSIAAIAFSQDNTILMTFSREEISRWNVKTGSQVSKSPGIRRYESVVFSHDGSRVATGTKEGRIRLWDVMTGRQLKSLKGHAIVSLLKKENTNVEVWTLAFSPDGKILASGSEDKTVQLWDLEKRTKLATLEAHEGWVTALAFSADGKILASGDANKVIKLWDVDTHKESATLLGHKNTVSNLTFSPEGTSQYSGCLASGSYDGTIRFWDPDNGKELVTFASGHIESVKTVAFSEDDVSLTIAASNNTVGVWRLQTKQEIATLDDHPSDESTIALSQDATRFVFQGWEGFRYGGRGSYRTLGNIQLWDIINKKVIPGPWQESGYSESFIFSPDNHILVASIVRKGIFAWHVNTGAELFHYNSEAQFRSKFVFSPDGKLLSRYGSFVKTQVWDITVQRELTLPNNKRHRALAFSPDNTTIALRVFDPRGVVIWSVTPTGIQESGRITDKSQGLGGELIFSPDGKTLIDSQFTIKKGGGIQLWDTKGNDLGSLFGHTTGITTLVFSHDGKTLASGSADGTVLLWDWEKIISKVKGNRGD